MLGAILAGGRNSRFPFPKGLIEIGGRSIAARTAALLGELVGPVVLSTNSPELYVSLGLPMLGDAVASEGPLSGILTVLMEAERRGDAAALVVACDMPYIKKDLLAHIIRRMRGEACVPLWEGRPEPLVAAYATSARGAVERALAEGRGSIRGLLRGLDVAYVAENDVRKLDPEGLSFRNINTTADFEAVVRGPLRRSAAG
jgi:molybdopterin-guanine dinucleotide biosynthesis protein A